VTTALLEDGKQLRWIEFNPEQCDHFHAATRAGRTRRGRRKGGLRQGGDERPRQQDRYNSIAATMYSIRARGVR
jgi:hypothetical protein